MGDNKSRVLGIVGSPREKGNTNAMVDAILQGAAMKGVATEMVQLSQRRSSLVMPVMLAEVKENAATMTICWTCLL